MNLYFEMTFSLPSPSSLLNDFLKVGLLVHSCYVMIVFPAFVHEELILILFDSKGVELLRVSAGILCKSQVIVLPKQKVS